MTFKNIAVTGNLTRDPEIHVFASGKSIAKASVAINDRSFNKETNAWEDGDTTFLDLVVFDRGSYIENVLTSLRKGDKVIATGTMRMREWDRKDEAGAVVDGPKGRTLELLVDEIGPSLRFAQCTITKVARTNGVAGGPPEESDYNL